MRISDWSSDVCSSDLGLIFVRSTSAFRMTAPSSPALSEDSDPPNLPTAVRIGATMAARRRVIGSISILGDADDTGIDQAGKLGARQRQALRQYFLAMLAVARFGSRRSEVPTSDLHSLILISFSVFSLKLF